MKTYNKKYDSEWFSLRRLFPDHDSSLCECVIVRSLRNPRYKLLAYDKCNMCRATGIPPVPISELPSFYPKTHQKAPGNDFNRIRAHPFIWSRLMGL